MIMSEKPDKKTKPKKEPCFGGLEYDIPDEVIQKNIRDYPYVMGKLKDC